MAEARARISCATDCAATIPSVDVIYRDVWTDPLTAGRAADAPFDYLYSDLATPAPVSAACEQAWMPECRIVINYESIVHPLWGEPRLAPDGLTDVTCTLCHNTQNALLQLQEPAGQLDLSDGLSTDQPDHFRSYRELMFSDNEQVLDMGALQDRLIEVGIDPVTGDPIFQTANIAPSMSVDGSMSSPRFFDRFMPGGPHEGYLSAAEIRLIAEWLDIGGQYFNNPFDAPQD